MQPALEAEPVHAGVRDVLLQVQVRAAGNLRQPRHMWRLLHRHDHPRQSNQVPLVAGPRHALLLLPVSLSYVLHKELCVFVLCMHASM
ncbi:hypothetical protein B296_00049872 [Ensete ventricosum]|uniref:Uncharacterized protein n=1 Tax=Ensete ventricosum TaxID=4639 RepID=A0A426Y934_ENSVE|nr:hypothetical protein B296_00049872 [Ensete ventricosum]